MGAAMKAVRGRFPPLVPCGLNCTVSSRDPMAVATQMFLPTTHVSDLSGYPHGTLRSTLRNRRQDLSRSSAHVHDLQDHHCHRCCFHRRSIDWRGRWDWSDRKVVGVVPRLVFTSLGSLPLAENL